MPSAREVQPEKWGEIIILFDNGEYSVISGIYDGGTRRVLGERWNGHVDEDRLGFPNVAGHPVWHVVPDFLKIPVLHGLLHELALHAQRASSGEALSDAVLREIATEVGPYAHR